MSLSGVCGPAYSHSMYESNMVKMAGYNGSTFPGAHVLSPRDLSVHVATGPHQVPTQHQPNSHQAQSLPSPVPAMFMPNYSAGRQSQAPFSPVSPLLSSVPAIASMPAMTQTSLRVPVSANTRVRHPGVDTLSPLASPSPSSRASTPRADSMSMSASTTLLPQGRAAHLDVNSRFRQQQPYFPASTSTAGPYHNNATLQIAMELRRQSAPALAGGTGGALPHSRHYSLAALSSNNLISDHVSEVLGESDSPSPSSSSGGGATPQRRRASRARAALVGRRRRASDLARDFWCPENECSRRYEAWRSLQHHLRADHDVRMRLRDYKVIRHDRGQDLLVDSRGAPIAATSDGDDNNSQSEQQTTSNNKRSTSSNNNKSNSEQGSNNASGESMQSGSGGSNNNSSSIMLANSSGDYGDFEDDDDDLAESSSFLRSVLPAMLSDAEIDSNMDFFPPRMDTFAGMKVPRRPAPSVARQRTQQQERKGSVPRIETTLAEMQSPEEEMIVRDLRGIDGQAAADPIFEADFLLSDLVISPSDLLFSTAPLPADFMHPPLSAARPLYRTDAAAAQHLGTLRYRTGNNNVGESGPADVAVRGQPDFLRHTQPMTGGGAQPQPMTDLFAYNLPSNSYGQLDEFNLLPV